MYNSRVHMAILLRGIKVRSCTASGNLVSHSHIQPELTANCFIAVLTYETCAQILLHLHSSFQLKMELSLITPVPEGDSHQDGDELINGKLWRVTGPYSSEELQTLKFHCISYVWGPAIEPVGSFFGCKREISDQTRPSLEAAIKAVHLITYPPEGKDIQAFWIDAICIPQLDVPARYKTLESMGYIYSLATSVLVILKEPIWNVITIASSNEYRKALSESDLRVLEEDNWISRVWTYQEIVNGPVGYFTSIDSTSGTKLVHAEKFFNCVGFSLSQWKTTNKIAESGVIAEFPNLSVFEDTMVDRNLSGYLNRTALGVLSNMALRAFDSNFPQNRLLASIGPLTEGASWGPPSTTLAQLSEKLMKICEGRNDYSFIFTSDLRSTENGKRWRPNATQLESEEPAHLVPIVNWHSTSDPFGETQRGHVGSEGLWLDNVIPLKPAREVNEASTKLIDKFLFSEISPFNATTRTHGIFGPESRPNADILSFLLTFLRQIGFTGHPEPIICENGYFFSQLKVKGNDSLQLYASPSLRWTFGVPGFARWMQDADGNDQDDYDYDWEEWRYCAGVFVGLVRMEGLESVLMM